MWIQTRVTVQKLLNCVLSSMTWTFDLWPWPFAWISLLSMVITPGNSWWYGEWNIVKKVWQMDRQTDGRTDWSIKKADWSQLKVGLVFMQFWSWNIRPQWQSRTTSTTKPEHFYVVNCDQPPKTPLILAREVIDSFHMENRTLLWLKSREY